MGKAALELFSQHYKTVADGVASAPGRVNLIGDHTDYTEGFVFPAPLRNKTSIAYKARHDAAVRAVSSNISDEIIFTPEAPSPEGWGKYVAGVLWVLREAGHEVRGLDLAITSDVPLAAGLSSSAALEVALLRAWREAYGLDLADVTLAKLAQRAEREYVGMPCGILDQFAASVPNIGQAVVLDCQSLEYHVREVPPDWAFIIINSNASRELTASAYAVRVQECTQAARLLGVPNLRAGDLEHLQALTGTLRQRARHVITENHRVQAAQHAMQRADITAFGQLMSASHQSLRLDYEVSSTPLDHLVGVCLSFEGCLGARLTGAGFGGCVVALVEAGASAAFTGYITQQAPQGDIVALLGA